MHKDPSRWQKLWDALEFFYQFLRLDCNKVCIENPIPHKYAKEGITFKYDQIIQPWMFGHTEMLWLINGDKLNK